MNAKQWIVECRDVTLRSLPNPLPVDDPKQRRPDITLAKKLLGWEPQVALEDGLRRTIAFFRDKV
jgi:nucleoside-diphosphate-sugar epimerase